MSEDLDDKKELIQHRDQLARERASEARDASQRFRIEIETAKERSRQRTAQLATTGNLEAMKLDHELDPERRDRDFLDLVRTENIRLQSLQTELQLTTNDRERQQNQDVNTATRLAMIEIVKAYTIKELGLGNKEELSLEEIAEVLEGLEDNGIE